MAAHQVIRMTGPVVLDWGNGMRLQISPVQGVAAAQPLQLKGKPGRKPSPATAQLRQVMAADAAAGVRRTRSAYLKVLATSGHVGPEASASMIVNREAKTAFGEPLGKEKRGGRKGKGGKLHRKPGRRASPVLAALRAKLATDKTAGQLRDAVHYVRWVVDQPGAEIGLKGARPMVYRELRAVR